MFPSELSWIPINVFSFRYIWHPKGFTYSPPSGKRYGNALVYVEKGSVHYTARGLDLTVLRDEVLFIPHGASYDSVYEEEENQIFAFFFLTESRSLGSEILRFRRNPGVTSIMTSLIKIYNAGRVKNKNYYISRLYSLLFLLQQEEYSTKYQRILPVVEYIDEHCEEDLKIHAYAEMAYMSESGFRKLFRECMGSSPIEYRNYVRMNRAAELIRSGYKDNEAAYAVGFRSLSFYYRKKREAPELFEMLDTKV